METWNDHLDELQKLLVMAITGFVGQEFATSALVAKGLIGKTCHLVGDYF